MYEVIEIKAFDCACEKCGYSWVSRRKELPTHCANKHCSNPSKWNEPGKSRKYVPKGTPTDSKIFEDVEKDFDFGA